MHKKHALSWEEAVLDLRARTDCQSLVLDAYYDDPLKEAADRYERSAEWQAVKAMLPPAPARVLDVGAGRGIVSYALAASGYTVTALEPDPSAIVGVEAILSLQRETGLSIQVVQGRAEEPPIESNAFDAICARAVLHHCQDLKKACAQFYRMLRPGGTLIAFREHVLSSRNDLPKFLDKHPLHKLYGGENAFLQAEYTGALKDAGFAIEGVLDPWQSPINYAPRTTDSLQAELAHRISQLTLIPERSLQVMIAQRRLWIVLVSILRRIDRRPGRLYSFIARA